MDDYYLTELQVTCLRIVEATESLHCLACGKSIKKQYITKNYHFPICHSCRVKLLEKGRLVGIMKPIDYHSYPDHNTHPNIVAPVTALAKQSSGRLAVQEGATPTYQVARRLDGRIEVACPDRGVGHTIFAPKAMGKAGYLHGCDGCCSKPEFKAFVKKLNLKKYGVAIKPM